MRGVLLASLRRYTRRYVAAVVAVVIGVAFVVLINPLTSGARSAILAGLDAPYQNSDVVVTGADPKIADDLIARAAERGEHVGVQAWTVQPLASGDRVVDRRADVATVATDPQMRWQELEGGRYPTADNEGLLDVNQAKSLDLGVGDTVEIGNRKIAIVGLADTPSAAAAGTVYLTWDALQHWQERLYVDSIAYAGSGSPAGQVEQLEQVIDEGSVTTTPEFLDDRAAELNQGVDVMAIMLLLFAAIAMAVSVLVIANTFSVLFAQRTRDFALLRCVGATRGQVRRGIRVEALVLGVISAALGVGSGAAAGLGLVALVRAKWPTAMGAASLDPVWLGAAFVAGVLVTVAAGWLPTRKATQVSPLAALRPDESPNAGGTAGRRRIALGLLIVVLGAAGLAVSVAGHTVPVMLISGFAAFVGILVLGPVIVPWFIRRLGMPAGALFGAPGRLAVGNACRNPKRTAATTASLLIGVTLTTAMLTGLASSRTAVDGDMDASHPVDFALDAAKPLAADTSDALASTEGVADVLMVPGVRAKAGHGIGDITVLAPDGGGEIPHGSAEFATPTPGEVVLPLGTGNVTPGDQVKVSVGGRSVELTVGSLAEGWGPTALVAPETLARLTDDPQALSAWVRGADGADVENLNGDLAAVANGAGAELTSELSERAYVYTQLDIMTITVVALLGIGVLIALIGIGSTLGLSVLERSRENALLRALGLTRAQLRRTLTVEAVLLSVAATLVGTIVGVIFAWVGVEVMVKGLVAETRMVIPVGQLAVAIGVSALAGLLACLLPARRAARTVPAAGLAMD